MEKNKLRVRFLGAVGTVTGSCTLLEYTCCTDGKKRNFLVDAGAYQNETSDQDFERKKVLSHIAKDIEKIFITHAHLDHIGILPEIIKYGFRGEVCCTAATRSLLTEMLTCGDGNENNKTLLAKVSFFDVDGRHGERQNNGFGRTYFNIGYDFRYGFLRTSHVLGSCSFYFQWTENAYPDGVLFPDKEWKYIHFSGDIGSVSDSVIANILFKEYQTPYWNQYEKCIVVESTYGERIRQKDNIIQRKIDKLTEIIEKAISKKGTVIIPAFALDRAQQILIDLFSIQKDKDNKLLLTENENDWINILHFVFDDTALKSINSLCKLPVLQGKDKKSLRKTLEKEIEQIYRNTKTDSTALFKNLPEECQKLIADVFKKHNVTKPNINDENLQKSRLRYAIDSPLIEKINEIYINRLTDESYCQKNNERKFKYLSYEFLERFNIIEGDINSKKSEIKKTLGICFNKNLKNADVIVAASGMCDEGRMVNLLEKYLTDENAVIVLTGFQAAGTNGSFLKNLLNGKYNEQDKNTIPFKLYRNDLRLADVKCSIEDMSEFYSGHADQEQLIEYVTPDERNKGKTTIMLNHGSEQARETLKSAMEEKGINVQLPEFNKWINLSSYENETDDIDYANEEKLELAFIKVNDFHIYYPSRLRTEKVEALADFINEL